MRLYGSLWFFIGPYVPLWILMGLMVLIGPYGSIWVLWGLCTVLANQMFTQ